MPSELPQKITDQIEVFCEQGCTRINQLLDRARNGHEIEELAEFSKSEVKQIIKELAEIMSVYENKNFPDEK